MSEELEKLLEAAKHRPLSPLDQEKQRRSFAYGNANIENERITRETVDREADDLLQNQGK